jgi:hypothetical protein
MIKLLEMTELMNNHVITETCRQKQKPVVKIQIAERRTTSPPSRVVLNRNALKHYSTPGRQLVEPSVYELPR